VKNKLATTLAAIAVFAPVSSYSMGGLPCDPVEYAELKDSTKKELNDLYCQSASKAELNEIMQGHSEKKRRLDITYGVSTKESDQEVNERSEAAVSCLKLMESTKRMMNKKFKSKPSCQSS
jgi:hypothetical protein